MGSKFIVSKPDTPAKAKTARINREKTATTLSVHRNEKGQFLTGNKASPGRPKRSTEAEYLESMHRAVSLEHWEGATRKMLMLALQGDVQAYRVLAPYFAGLPAQKLQLSNGDAALLSQVLDLLKVRGVPASDVFEQMIGLLAENELTEGE